MHILLVEDDPVISNAICTYLETLSIKVAHAPTLSSAKLFLTISCFDVCVLDLSLPDGDGLNLLQSLRKTENSLPILILTARGSIDDKVKGLEHGADDYLAKPFDFRELVARIKSLCRRSEGRTSNTIKLAELEFDLDSQIATMSGKRLKLSKTETLLLSTFLSRPTQIITESTLKDAIYGVHDDVASNSLNVHLFNLRKKLGGQYIITERGLGFRLAQEKELKA